MSLRDVIIIGGGPAGSTAATFLREAGKSVLVLEREHFPRFHIGESLLPYNTRLFREMGLLDKVRALGSVRKLGARFTTSSGERSTRVRFSEGHFNEEGESFQVERAPFDEMLLRHAAGKGAEIIEGARVTEYAIEPDHVRVVADNDIHEARFLIDATGMANFTGRREGMTENHPGLRKVAIFGHFHGVTLPEGEEAGDIVIARLENEWAWLIPLAEGRVSVGVVLDRSAVKGAAPADHFDRIVASSSYLRGRMEHADRTGELHVLADYSYRNRRFASRRLLRVGDAAGFIDPIFSSGVYLAMLSGRDGARAVVSALEKNRPMVPAMRRYGKRLGAQMDLYRNMIELFYTRPFIELLFEQESPFRLRCAVNSLLAGRLDVPWAVRWRLRVFYLLVRVQARFALVPSLPLSG
jgi:flavin-dependent dehydrogenase